MFKSKFKGALEFHSCPSMTSGKGFRVNPGQALGHDL